MRVATNGTEVMFAEVAWEAWSSARTVPFVRERQYQRNITYTLGQRGLDLSRSGTAVLAVPAPAISRGLADITSPTECRQVLANGITDPQAAVAVDLHAPRLVGSQHGVGHEFVIAEHGVVIPRRHGSMIRPCVIPGDMDAAALVMNRMLEVAG